MPHFADPYPSYAIDLARQLRKRSTAAEQKLWDALRGRKCDDLKFRRQHRIQNYIVDFYCHELLLVVEVEGSIHDIQDQREYDAVRFDTFQSLGLQVLRVRNERVLEQIDEVVEEIIAFKPSPR